jgi:hypothetical protein
MGAVPHLTFGSHTPPPQRPFVGGARHRRVLKLLVAIRSGYAPVVLPLTGTKYKGCPDLLAYKNKHGKALTKLGGLEYRDCLEAITRAEPIQPRRARTAPIPLVFHDHERAHTSNVVQDWLEEQGIKVLLCPVRSPDLDPLDYGVFGLAKQRQRRRVHAGGVGWHDACAAMVADLKAMDVEATIRQFPKRLEACIKAGGGYFEGDL